MTEKLKYKVGDKVLIEAEVVEIDNRNAIPYRVTCVADAVWISQSELEECIVHLPPKPKIPQAVMDWHGKHKDSDWNMWDYLKHVPEELEDWLFHSNEILKNQQALATLIAYGPEAVEVETEKIYRVKIKNLVTSDGKEQFLTHDIPKRKVFASRHGMNLKQTFTKRELVSLGFEGVFDNPMFEVEEVE